MSAFKSRTQPLVSLVSYLAFDILQTAADVVIIFDSGEYPRKGHFMLLTVRGLSSLYLLSIYCRLESSGACKEILFELHLFVMLPVDSLRISCCLSE